MKFPFEGYNPYKWPYNWVTGVKKPYLLGPHNSTYNWFLGPPCNDIPYFPGRSPVSFRESNDSSSTYRPSDLCRDFGVLGPCGFRPLELGTPEKSPPSAVTLDDPGCLG